MQLTSILSVALLSSLAIAAPHRSLSKSKPNPALTWHASNFTVASPQSSGSPYSFHILGIASPNTPGFNATCTGTTGKKDYQPCQNQDISAIVSPQPASHWNIEVQHGWTKGQAEYWNNGNTNITAPAKAFEINVEDSYGVA